MEKIVITALFVVLSVPISMFAWAADEPQAIEEIQEEKVSGEIAASILSAYIWRGQELTRHSVVLQPSIMVSYRGFAASLWCNLDTKPYTVDGHKNSSNFTETDVTLSYSRAFGILQAGVGYIYYGLSGSAAGGEDLLDSQEIFVSLGLDTLLAPTLTVYKEIDHYHQWYATLGISHTFSLHEKIGLKLAANVSYLKSEDATTYPEFDKNSAATDKKFNNFHDGVFSVSLPVTVIKTLTITPTLSYVFPLSDDAKYEMRGRGLKGTANPSDRDSSYFYGGIVLSYAF
ncbi:MAG: hypothetical protein JW914_08370 [Syntrophaceae bacterium]|nr:hypothetical protein [Syntrophaceae bacterium]